MIDHATAVDATPEDTLVQRQIKNEEEIINKGISKFRGCLAEAQQKGKVTTTLPGRWLLTQTLKPVAKKIQEYVADAFSGKSGVIAEGAKILNLLYPESCAFVCLRVIMNSLLSDKGSCALSKILGRIQRELVDELQFNYMKDNDTPTYQYWMQELDKTANKRTRGRIMARLKKGFTLPKFNSEDHQIALAAAARLLVHFVTTTTDIAEIKKEIVTKGGRVKTPTMLVRNPHFEARFEALNARAALLWPKYEPMLCPPRPWTGAYRGGFIGKLGERTKLVRTGNRSYLEEIHNNIGKMSNVLKALNIIQATPWRINRKIYEVMEVAFSTSSGRYGLPQGEPLPPPIAEPDIETNSESRKRFARALKAIQTLEQRRNSQRSAVRRMLDTAWNYLEEKKIYFAYNLDWRGRIYPLASYLSPQGDETHRALLEFAQGLPLETPEAVEWLAVHGAGCFGHDKVSFEDRVQWCHLHEKDIRESVAAPLDCGFWTAADKPWMFLAWCHEWVDYLTDGKNHVSHIPVAMDGSCNGLQNFAAMLRHEGTARAVNLAPSALPNDIYQQVADKVLPVVRQIALRDSRTDDQLLEAVRPRTEREYADKKRFGKERAAIHKRQKAGKITHDEAAEMYRNIKLEISKEERGATKAMWDVLSARWIKDHITRKLVKRPVMTYPYSVTLYGMQDQIADTLLEMKDSTSYDIDHRMKVADMLKRVVYEAIQNTVVAAAKAMRWLREAAKIVAEENLPVTWVSPVGMLVMQNYWEPTYRKIQIESRRMEIKMDFNVCVESAKRVKISKQAAGVAPNFVHSCDASHLMFTVNACFGDGVTDFHMIHDSYATHARHAATLARNLREQFVAMYSGNALCDFRQQLCAQIRPDLAKRIPEPPAQSTFDLNQVLQARYFFA